MAENLRQLGWAQFARSTSARNKVRQSHSLKNTEGKEITVRFKLSRTITSNCSKQYKVVENNVHIALIVVYYRSV